MRLWAGIAEKWSRAPAWFVFVDVDFSGKARVGFGRTRFRQNPAALNVFTLGAPHQNPHITARLTLVEQFTEHFNACAGGLGRWPDANNFYFFAHLNYAALNAARDHRAPA